jgi:hypothetical protein
MRTILIAAAMAFIMILGVVLTLAVLQMGEVESGLGFTLFWAGLALLCLAVTARSIRQGDLDAAVAWWYITLPVTFGLVLLTLPLTHIGETLIYGPASGAAWLALLLSIAATGAVMWAIHATKAARPETNA